MNQEQILSLVRQILLSVGTVGVTKGVIDADTLNTVVGLLMQFGAVVWSLYVRRNNGLVASAAAVPGVTQIVTTPAMAAAVPSDKVVGPSP